MNIKTTKKMTRAPNKKNGAKLEKANKKQTYRINKKSPSYEGLGLLAASLGSCYYKVIGNNVRIYLRHLLDT